MRYGVFLRSINVGKHNRIKMEDLRKLIEGLGYKDVSTYLQTGNIVLAAQGPSEEIRDKIEAALAANGLRGAAAIVRTEAELRQLVADDHFGEYPRETN